MPPNDTPTTAQRELEPSAEAAAHSARLREILLTRITAAGGFLSFEQYMDAALYEPGLGYYSAGARKLGASGDFVTAPELSPLFGGCIAAQCVPILKQLPHGVIMEIGAGSGRLALDVLTRLAASDALPQRYYILEISAELRERQRRLLEQAGAACLARVVWLDAPPLEPFEGIIVANEVLDALPVARFRYGAGGIDEMGVTARDGALAWAQRAASATMAQHCRRLRQAGGDWQEGYTSEYCPRLLPWCVEVTRPLGRGVVLWIDYGLPRAQYYFPERREGTLLCHYRHRAHHDPFWYPGLQDITAWVDFTALAEASRAAGFELQGFTTQAHFLAACGIDQEMQWLAGGDAAVFARLAGQARQLLLPGEMGERFKVMAWSRDLHLELRGFAHADLSHSL